MMLKEKEEHEIQRAPSPSDERKHFLKDSTDSDPVGSQRVYKKTSSNQLLTLYLGSRELVCRKGVIEPLKGVVYIDPKVSPDSKIYGQLTLTFRYGREDEEVMGLKFCNEAVIALQMIWPKTEKEQEQEDLTPLQEALIDRLGKNAVAFSLEICTIPPPSVQLLPAKRYTGAPIGTSYDVRVFTAEASTDERVQRRSTVRLGIRLIHKICPESGKASILDSTVSNSVHVDSTDAPAPPVQTINTQMPRSLRLRLSPKSLKLSSLHKQSNSVDSANNGGIIELTDVNKGPQGSVDKPFLWADGRVNLKASLNKSAYVHGEHVTVTIDVKNDSRKIVRKIRLVAVQHVDVCMFSNGKFKNIVAEVDITKHIGPSEHMHSSYSLLPVRGTTKNWIAVEGALFSSSQADPLATVHQSRLATSAPRGVCMQPSTDEKNVFAIYVSYYIKVKLILSSMGGEVSLKLPFILGHVEFNQPDAKSDLQLHLKRLKEMNKKSLGASTSVCSEDTRTLSEISEKKVEEILLQKCEIEEDISSTTSHEQSVTKNLTCNRREMFKNSKFNENINSTIDVITEDFHNISSPINQLVKSDSSKSNLNDADDDDEDEEEGGCNQEIAVIQAQIHSQQNADEEEKDDDNDNKGDV